jgi:tyrosinase
MITRRETLRRFVSGSVAVFAGTVPGVRALATPLPVRKEVNGLALGDPILQTLREGVKILKARLPGQGPSWTDMSNIHGTPAGGFNKCPHGNWYFLPWHRAYVLMYERMIRAVTNNPAFAMPYWDWAAHRKVPQAFADATYNGQANPLYVAARNNGWSVPDIYVGPSVMSAIYGQTNFELFASSRPAGQNNLNASWIKAHGTQGTLEANPHNNIHNNLGGYMPGFNSPMDPIFQMHHGNIDHIWWSWNCRGRQNTTDTLWLNMPFTNNYYTPTGTWTTYRPADVLNIGTLGYSYGLCLLRLPPIFLRELANRRLTEIFRVGRAASAHPAGAQVLQLRNQVREGQFEAVGAAPPALLRNTFLNISKPPKTLNVAAANGTSQVVALIHNLTPPTDDVEVLVFAGSGGEPLGSDPRDPHFVEAIGFFGAHAHGGGGISASVDLTEHLRALPTQGDQVQVRLVARRIGRDGPDVQSTVAQADVEVVIV